MHAPRYRRAAGDGGRNRTRCRRVDLPASNPPDPRRLRCRSPGSRCRSARCASAPCVFRVARGRRLVPRCQHRLPRSLSDAPGLLLRIHELVAGTLARDTTRSESPAARRRPLRGSGLRLRPTPSRAARCAPGRGPNVFLPSPLRTWITLRLVSGLAMRNSYLPAGSATPGISTLPLNVKNVRLSAGCADAVPGATTASVAAAYTTPSHFDLSISSSIPHREVSSLGSSRVGSSVPPSTTGSELFSRVVLGASRVRWPLRWLAAPPLRPASFASSSVHREPCPFDGPHGRPCWRSHAACHDPSQRNRVSPWSRCLQLSVNPSFERWCNSCTLTEQG